MNTFAKYTANVFVAKCEEQHEKGDTIIVETKYGRKHECVVFNLVSMKDGFYHYSIVRTDGFNAQEFAKKKAERYQQWATSAENKSTEYWKASQEGKDFLALGEPIKVGHHSEKRHRALIERNWNRMSKAVAETEKVKQHESKADYWNARAEQINLSMPESIEFFEHKVEELTELHQGLKSGKYEKRHSYSLTYARKDLNEAKKKLELAIKLWQ